MVRHFRYSSSRRRIALLIVLLGMAAVLVTKGFAQPAPAPAGGAGGAGTATTTTMPTQNLFQLIWGHKDPVFFTIMALSVTGLTLIIQGFIKNRAAVMMP